MFANLKTCSRAARHKTFPVAAAYLFPADIKIESVVEELSTFLRQIARNFRPAAFYGRIFSPAAAVFANYLLPFGGKKDINQSYLSSREPRVLGLESKKISSDLRHGT
jgi:hypothetical protein